MQNSMVQPQTAPMQILVRVNDEIIQKYTSKQEVMLDLMISDNSLLSNAMRSEQGLSVDIGASNAKNTHHPAGNQHAQLIVNFKATTLSLHITWISSIADGL